MLLRSSFEVFLPMQKVMRQWSDRKKKVEVPLFNSYIFVKESEDKIQTILQTPGVSWNIRHNDKPAVLHEHELNLINRFITAGHFIEVSSKEELVKGDAVEILDGHLKGIKGNFVSTKSGHRFTLSLESLGNSIYVEIDPVLVKKIV